MDRAILEQEVSANYDAFQRVVGRLIASHRDQFALMRNAQIVEFFEKPGEAYRAGVARFSDARFSIQEVTEEPIDLGFFSHVAY